MNEVDKIFIRSNVSRCRELYDTGILMDGNKNPFVQSVLLEIVVRLRHLNQVFDKGSNKGLIGFRIIFAHPENSRFIAGTSIAVEFCRNYKGNWEYDGLNFIPKDNDCDVEFQCGDKLISTKKDILPLIEKYEKLLEDQI